MIGRRAIRRLIRGDAHMREVVRLASSGLVLRGGATGLRFGIAVLVARLLGADGAGLYFFVVSVINTASIFGRAGISNMLIRYVAENVAKKDWASARFVYKTAQRIVGGVSAVIAIVLVLSAQWSAKTVFHKPEYEIPLILAGLTLVPFALSWTVGDALRALRRIPAAQLVKAVIPAVVTFVLMYPLIRLWRADGAIVAFGLGSAVALLFGLHRWRREWRKLAGPGVDPGTTDLTIRLLLASSWALFGVGLANLGIQNLASVILGVWGTNADIGVFNVANRVSTLLLLPYFGMIGILAPKFVQLNTLRDTATLKALIRSSTWLLLIITIPLAAIIFVAAGPVMKVFGSHFENSVPILRILMIATVFQAGTGPTGSMLIMCGRERQILTLSLVTLFIAVGLCIVGTRFYGVIGLSWAVVFALVVQNIAQIFMIRIYMGFWPIGLLPR